MYEYNVIIPIEFTKLQCMREKKLYIILINFDSLFQENVHT